LFVFQAQTNGAVSCWAQFISRENQMRMRIRTQRDRESERARESVRLRFVVIMLLLVFTPLSLPSLTLDWD